MRLSRIEIENFKGVGARQVIELRPITLLFGPNSAGKSTILQALHYVREILERRNPDPDQTIAGGLIDLGGFKNLIHNHDLSKSMTIKLVIDLADDQGNERLPINNGNSLDDPEFEHLRIRYIVGENTDLKEYAVVQEIGVSLQIQWSDLINSPYVSALTVEMDGGQIATIKSPPQPGQAQLTEFNFQHPLLQEYIGADGGPSQDMDENDPLGTKLGIEIWELSREMARSADLKGVSEFRVAVASVIGALPDINKRWTLELRDPEPRKLELEGNTPRVRGLSALLDELLLGPLRIARDYLSGMTYIGPLRDIPPRAFRPQVSPDEGRWAQGLAAWDLLYSDTKEELLSEVNAWLSGEDGLGTNYEIAKSEYLEIPVSSRIDQLFKRGINEDDIGELQEEFQKLTARTEVVLRDVVKGISVAPSDVGVGISQMIPVIVACLRDKDGILAIEQPELHIHPAIQVGVGDLFIHAVMPGEQSFGSGKTLLVETHSEHIMLRLLRRVRETTEGELPPGVISLTPNDLSVIYVENTTEEVRFRQLRVDSDGDFADRWPNGFFAERAEELF
ncbi:AAA family ATPase [uncultured Agrobacterium sp.]|uniref:AAA family ATPase n=1 Tax=uncultured Agrobacterium sp. TaxID=157277 RepID=UPI0025D04E1F|nr:AAA family ATPase [uncultured Agrobacterium sp.]